MDMKNKIDCYGACVNMRVSEAQIQWERFNAMLVINTIFIGLIGFTFSKDFNVPSPIKELLPLLGILLSILWYKVTKRGFMWTKFWTDEAREIEKENMSENKIRPFNEGLIHKIDNKAFLNTEWSSYFIIFIFLFLYLILFINNIILLINRFCVF